MEQDRATQGGLGRRLAMLGWRLVRPVARPVAWRIRSFLTAEVMAELADARVRQEASLHRLDGLLRHAATAPPKVEGGAGLDPGLVAVLERLLLTMALEDSARVDPPGLAGLAAPAGLSKPGDAG